MRPSQSDPNSLKPLSSSLDSHPMRFPMMQSWFLNHDIYSFLPLLILFSLSRTAFSSDGSNKGMTYRDTVKVKGSYKSGWDIHRVTEWDALIFCRLKGQGGEIPLPHLSESWSLGGRAISRNCRQGGLEPLPNHSAEAERGQWINTPNSPPPANLRQVSLIGQSQLGASQPPRMGRWCSLLIKKWDRERQRINGGMREGGIKWRITTSSPFIYSKIPCVF